MTAPAAFDPLRLFSELNDVDGLTVFVASIDDLIRDDLIRMKRAAGRPRNLTELEVLEALRDGPRRRC